MYNADEILTVGIVGAGQGVRTHAVTLSRLPGVRVVGVTGLTLDLARAALRDRGLDPDLACTFDTLVESEPDLVCLATPPTVREQYVTSLAGTRSALLIEKPLEASAARARSVYAVLAGRAQPAFLNVQLRGLPAFRQIREIIRAGELGTVHSVLMRERTGWRRNSCEPWQAWRAFGGGQRLDLGPHLLDLVVFLMGWSYPEMLKYAYPVCGSATPWPPAIPDVNNDAADAVFQAAFCYDSCWTSLYTTSVGTGPESFELDIEGSDGRLTFLFGPGGGIFNMYRSAKIPELQLYLASGGTLEDPKVALAGETPASLFKLAYRFYIEHVLMAISYGDRIDELASVKDGLANLDMLDLIIGNERSSAATRLRSRKLSNPSSPGWPSESQRASRASRRHGFDVR